MAVPTKPPTAPETKLLKSWPWGVCNCLSIKHSEPKGTMSPLLWASVYGLGRYIRSILHSTKRVCEKTSTLHIISQADILPPECCLHSSVKPKNAFFPDNLLNNIYWACESACFILQPTMAYEHSTQECGEQWQVHLILTSSNGTTTKDSVAPALHPVRIESCCVILLSPDIPMNVFPQKSLAALSKKKYLARKVSKL